MRKQGFTLIEMLLVLTILGILVMILIPSVIGVTKETKENKVRADLHLIRAALGKYYVKNNDFPASGSTAWAQLLIDTEPRILEKAPEDPFAPAGASDTYYQYEYMKPVASGQRPTYVLYSVGFSQQEWADVVDYDEVDYTADCIYATNAATNTVSP